MKHKLITTTLMLMFFSVHNLFTQPTNGLVGYWPFNGNANDESPNTNNGTTYNVTAVADRFGNPASAYEFNGTNSYIQIPNNSSLNFGTNSFSISSWIYTETLPNSWKSIVNKGASGSIGYGVEISSSNQYIGSIQGNAGVNQHCYGSLAEINKWVHLVVVFERNNSLRIYVDNSIVEECGYSSGNATSVDNSRSLNFGKYETWYFDGKIDDVRIYNRALSGSEIQELYLENETIVPVTGITVTPVIANISVDGTIQLTATVLPANATNKSVTWTSMNTSVATVNSNGLVTGVSAGYAEIRATTVDGGFVFSCDVNVTSGTVPVTGITIIPSSASIVVGGTQQLTETVSPSNATNKTVTWTSGNTSVATVNSSGLVTAVSEGGPVTITVQTQDGGFTATCAVTVTAGGSTGYWLPGTGGIYYGGNVGIGTDAPACRLDIAATGDGISLLRLKTDRPWRFKQVGIDAQTSLALESEVDGKFFLIRSPSGTVNTKFYVSNTPASNFIYLVPDGGRVGIGTTNTTAVLTVNGDIKAERIDVVTGITMNGILDANGIRLRNKVPSSDHVFGSDYDLMTLKELDEFIKANRHLPEVPSAEQFKENGYSVGEMDDLLLRKIEELTLYIIEQEKSLKLQMESIEKLSDENRNLKEEILQLHELIEK